MAPQAADLFDTDFEAIEHSAPAIKRGVMNTYTPLPNTSCTRLVCLKPSIDLEAVIGISLLVTDLDSEICPRYEAVSYTWGDEDDTVEVQLNGQPRRIRRNLHQGLLRLRHSTVIRYLWVDALSISQVDLNEKAAQVQMIGEIFSLAESVHVWLGEHADGSEELFRGWREYNGGLDPLQAADRREISRRITIWTAFLARRYWSRL